MSFYLKPSTGSISLQKLEAIAITRLGFLLKVHRKGDNPVDLLDIVKTEGCVQESDCLIGGSHKDNISHFILRLLLAGDPEAQRFILEAETRLFAFRFSCMTETEIYWLFKSVQRITHRVIYPESSSFNELNPKHLLSVILSIRNNCGSWKSVTRKYIQGCHGEHFLSPFQAATMLVSKREVTLDKGMARVPFSKMNDILTEVFRKLLAASFGRDRELSDSRLVRDKRMTKLQQLLKAIFRRNYLDSGHGAMRLLCVNKIDKESRLFPPCMKNLHQVLRNKHRLRHHDRIQYTLFLKEAGMSLHQALMFWSGEYSHGAPLENGCPHSWQTDERRYVYNIRHLYGLEGSRINYRSHCCASIQKRQLTAGDEGGCPFVHFDDHHLHRFMSTSQIPEYRQKQILNLKSKGKPSKCCEMYLQCVKDSSNTTGTKYLPDDDSSNTSGMDSHLQCINNCSDRTRTKNLPDGDLSNISQSGIDSFLECLKHSSDTTGTKYLRDVDHPGTTGMNSYLQCVKDSSNITGTKYLPDEDSSNTTGTNNYKPCVSDSSNTFGTNSYQHYVKDFSNTCGTNMDLPCVKSTSNKRGASNVLPHDEDSSNTPVSNMDISSSFGSDSYLDCGKDCANTTRINLDLHTVLHSFNRGERKIASVSSLCTTGPPAISQCPGLSSQDSPGPVISKTSSRLSSCSKRPTACSQVQSVSLCCSTEPGAVPKTSSLQLCQNPFPSPSTAKKLRKLPYPSSQCCRCETNCSSTLLHKKISVPETTHSSLPFCHNPCLDSPVQETNGHSCCSHRLMANHSNIYKTGTKLNLNIQSSKLSTSKGSMVDSMQILTRPCSESNTVGNCEALCANMKTHPIFQQHQAGCDNTSSHLESFPKMSLISGGCGGRTLTASLSLMSHRCSDCKGSESVSSMSSGSTDGKCNSSVSEGCGDSTFNESVLSVLDECVDSKCNESVSCGISDSKCKETLSPMFDECIDSKCNESVTSVFDGCVDSKCKEPVTSVFDGCVDSKCKESVTSVFDGCVDSKCKESVTSFDGCVDSKCKESVTSFDGCVDSKCKESVLPGADSSLPQRCADSCSCFQHELCPQIASNVQMTSVGDQRQVCTDRFSIDKPLDYYTSFRRLVEGLASDDSEFTISSTE
ncbi:uncharacterized protein LOC121387853 [Gigantopelta aegis]|uniref:uncharacterized protein LOC121387853 n=1 Tax=Gigantopelta aegis TaxID=1735272 RepID=UPI001B88DCC6|nr:uncharacterized protein LOC121387853 [Gigantopelta aegis]